MIGYLGIIDFEDHGVEEEVKGGQEELRNIQAFCYVFPCDFARKHNKVDIFGTGGSILDGMKSLLMKLPGLKKVELIDLQLDVVDGMYSSFFLIF